MDIPQILRCREGNANTGNCLAWSPLKAVFLSQKPGGTCIGRAVFMHRVSDRVLLLLIGFSLWEARSQPGETLF